MRKRILGFTLAALLVPAAALAGNTATQSVTVTVSSIDEVAVTGGAVTLTINSATAGSEPDAASDSTTGLAWTTNDAGQKITVETDLASPTFTLQVLATGVTGGSAALEQTVSHTAADFITGMSAQTGGCTLQYDASASAAQGTGSDGHTITFTMLAGS
jgi:hypothetical protein